MVGSLLKSPGGAGDSGTEATGQIPFKKHTSPEYTTCCITHDSPVIHIYLYARFIRVHVPNTCSPFKCLYGL